MVRPRPFGLRQFGETAFQPFANNWTAKALPPLGHTSPYERHQAKAFSHGLLKLFPWESALFPDTLVPHFHANSLGIDPATNKGSSNGVLGLLDGIRRALFFKARLHIGDPPMPAQGAGTETLPKDDSLPRHGQPPQERIQNCCVKVLVSVTRIFAHTVSQERHPERSRTCASAGVGPFEANWRVSPCHRWDAL